MGLIPSLIPSKIPPKNPFQIRFHLPSFISNKMVLSVIVILLVSVKFVLFSLLLAFVEILTTRIKINTSNFKMLGYKYKSGNVF